MLTTAWKNDAENLRALGYTPSDDTRSIVKKSSAAETLREMQTWAMQLATISKMEVPSIPDDHPLKDILDGMEVLCAMSAKEGTALAFYKICGDTLYINGCLGNIGIGTNEIAEEVLVRRLVADATTAGLSRVSVQARVAPSGTVHIPQYYVKLGFKPCAEAAAFSAGPGAELAAAARKKANELPFSEEVIAGMGWYGMWTPADGAAALTHTLDL